MRIPARSRAITMVWLDTSQRRSAGSTPTMALTDFQKAFLLRIARESVIGHITTGQPLGDVVCDLPEASGAFVTIKRRGELRGCIGTLQCRAGLAAEVARCAQQSATQDPRFPSVSAV